MTRRSMGMAVFMPIAAATDVAALRAKAEAARRTSQDMRRDALAAQWRASGARLLHHDMRLELAWTLLQRHRLLDGERGYFVPFHAVRRDWRRDP